MNSDKKYFYCAECETKVKALEYFRSWCPCKESSVVATATNITYHGCAVPEDLWAAMETPDLKIVFSPTTSGMHE